VNTCLRKLLTIAEIDRMLTGIDCASRDLVVTAILGSGSTISVRRCRVSASGPFSPTIV